MKTLKAFEDAHRRLAFRAERMHDDGERIRHLEACDVAISLMQQGYTDATELWIEYPADITPVDGVSQPKDTGADVPLLSPSDRDDHDLDLINDGDDSTPQGR